MGAGTIVRRATAGARYKSALKILRLGLVAEGITKGATYKVVAGARFRYIYFPE